MPRSPLSVKPEAKPSLIGPAIVLLAFGACLPLALPLPPSGQSGDACLSVSHEPSDARPTSTALLERCLGLYPDDPELAADLGAAHEAAGDDARAETAYRRALLSDSDYAEVRLRLGRLLLRRGAVAEARAEALAALRVQPNRLELVELLTAAGDAHVGDRP